MGENMLRRSEVFRIPTGQTQIGQREKHVFRCEAPLKTGKLPKTRQKPPARTLTNGITTLAAQKQNCIFLSTAWFL